jgi:hypothetical protein
MRSNLVRDAYKGLYGEEPEHDMTLEYSNRLKDYNAHVKIAGRRLLFVLSADWEDVNEDIRSGLIQSLLIKALKRPGGSMNLDIYNNFVKKLHLAVEKREPHPVLKESFDRVNQKYFYGTMEMPNLVMGRRATRTLGTYHFHTDTITISSVLGHADPELLDYIMYHEVLHKKLKFSSSGLRNRYHTGDFREKEKQFERSEEVERRLKAFLAGL